ncbi:hypothetical protein D6829_00660 [Candidatus Pacearchaeota archaeon]|nr:MAG: hypothetical protein D6829_00660 [Candidatus Pacearchaeota archaeon]
MKEKENILRILRKARADILENNPYELKSLSDQTIHSATISQDPDNIIVAVLVYALSKVFTRENYRRMDGWDEFYNSVVKNLEFAVKHLEKDEIDKVRVHLGRIRNSINKISGSLRIYISDVFRKAEINKAFKLYEHGLSSEKTARLLGISLWDLASYIGQSSISEAKIAVSMPVKERIKIVRDIFK